MWSQTSTDGLYSFIHYGTIVCSHKYDKGQIWAEALPTKSSVYHNNAMVIFETTYSHLNEFKQYFFIYT